MKGTGALDETKKQKREAVGRKMIELQDEITEKVNKETYEELRKSF